MTGAEAAEQTANKAEKTAARSLTPEQNENNEDDGPGTPLCIGESQGGTTITLALRTPERLRRVYNFASSLAFEGPDSSEGPDLSEGPDSPESQAQPPASTAPARIEGEGARKRRRVRNKLYRDSQYEL